MDTIDSVGNDIENETSLTIDELNTIKEINRTIEEYKKFLKIWNAFENIGMVGGLIGGGCIGYNISQKIALKSIQSTFVNCGGRSLGATAVTSTLKTVGTKAGGNMITGLFSLPVPGVGWTIGGPLLGIGVIKLISELSIMTINAYRKNQIEKYSGFLLSLLNRYMIFNCCSQYIVKDICEKYIELIENAKVVFDHYNDDVKQIIRKIEQLKKENM